MAALALIGTSVYAAPDRTGKTDVGVDVAYSDLTDDETNSATYVGGSVSHGLNEWLALGVSFGWQSFGSDDVFISGVTIPGPDLRSYPLFADIIVRIPTGDQPFVPYGVIGFGAIFWDADEVTASNGVKIKTDVDTSFGFKLAGGVDWFLNDHWALNFNGGYVFTDANTTVTATAGNLSVSAADKSDLDYWTIGAGLKFIF